MCWKRTPEVNAFIISKYFCLKSNLPAWSLVCWWSCLADSGFQELSCCLRQLLIIVQWHYVQSNMENWAIAYSFKGWLHEHQMSGVMATSRQAWHWNSSQDLNLISDIWPTRMEREGERERIGNDMGF